MTPRTRRLIVTGVHPERAVELTEEDLEAAVTSLECHRQYLAALDGHPAPRAMITGATEDTGRAAGVTYTLWIHHQSPLRQSLHSWVTSRQPADFPSSSAIR